MSKIVMISVDTSDGQLDLLADTSSNSVDASSDQAGAASDAPALYSDYAGSKYYTRHNLDQGFYTPWGDQTIKMGSNYIRNFISIVGVVIFLCFSCIFAFEFIVNVIDEFKRNTR